MQERAESDRPWLFFREGIDWQWLSYRRAAARVAEVAEAAATAPSPAAFDVETLIARLASRPQEESDSTSLAARLEAARLEAAQLVPRPIVFAAPVMDALCDVALATLKLGKLGAAWAIEPQPDAFVATTQWVRPTIVVAPEQALDELTNAWDARDARWSRLKLAALWPPAAEVPEAARQRWRETLRCTISA